MYICVCHAVTDAHIEQAVRDGAATLRELYTRLGVATRCGVCAPAARDCLRDALAAAQAEASALGCPSPLPAQPVPALAPRLEPGPHRPHSHRHEEPPLLEGPSVLCPA